MTKDRDPLDDLEPGLAAMIRDHFSRPEPLIGPNQYHGKYGEAIEVLPIEPLRGSEMDSQ
jgi:hypothetical protein